MYKGEADYHIPEQAVLDTIEAIPNGLAEGGIAKGVGHLIMMEQPKRLADACLKFLRGRQII
jgi:pimeloyl-ACP methyl ester carboxylesterase